MGITIEGSIGLFLFLIIHNQPVFSNDYPVTLLKEGLAGPVKSVQWEIQEFDMVDNRKEWKKPHLWRSIDFDGNGNAIREAFYDDSNRCCSVSTFERKDIGILAITDSVSIRGEKQRFIRQYNNDGKIMNERLEDENGKTIRRWIFQWDGTDRKDDVQVFGEDGKVRGSSEWFYDERFRVIRKCATGKKDLEVRYEYDDRGRIRRKEHIQRYSGERFVMTYEDGREISHETYDLDNHLKYRNTYRYEYDDRGNWILQVIIAQPIPGEEWAASEVQRTIRTIEYD